MEWDKNGITYAVIWAVIMLMFCSTMDHIATMKSDVDKYKAFVNAQALVLQYKASHAQ